jgi:hypothetical protein
MSNIFSYHKKQQDERYLNSGAWKCEGSPTGAHQWEVTSYIKNRMMVSKHICSVCKKEKTVLKQVY